MHFLDKKVQEILVQAAKNIIEKAQDNLKEGLLKRSLRYEENVGSVDLIMEEYGVFKDKGVTGAGRSDFRGKKKKIHQSKGGFKFNSSKQSIGGEASINSWMKRRGISSSLITQKSLNFLIRRSIHQHGIRPSLFLTKPYEHYTEEIIEEFNNLHEAITKDIDGKNR